MGSSTTSIQSIFDFLASMGEVSTVLPVGGYTTANSLTIATDVMRDLISTRFNFKWNRMKVKPFYTVTYAYDYAQIGLANLGWLESCRWKDIKNTGMPQPEDRMEAVSTLETTSDVGNPPWKIAWFPNSQLDQEAWPGPGVLYTDPLGIVETPMNGPINILDDEGNILVLTTYGTTGVLAPVAPAEAPEGTQILDGTCIWTVASPDSQGFRIYPRSPERPVVYEVRPIAQMKPPPPFTRMQQLINPVPDDFAHHFRTGCRIHTYKISPNPQMQKTFSAVREEWLLSMGGAAQQADREMGNAGFIPDRGAVSGDGGYDVGPANPYQWMNWGGGR